MWPRKPWAVEPEFGPEFEILKNGPAVLHRDGQIAGHVATWPGHFRTPFAPRTPQP